MPSLTVVYARSHTVGGLLIRFRDPFGRWSHCGVVTERQTVIEAESFKGVVETDIQEFVSRYKSAAYAFVEVECPNPQAGIDWYRGQVGRGYDYLGILGLALRTGWEDRNKWQCAEGVETSLIHAGKNRFRNQPSFISPSLSYMVI